MGTEGLCVNVGLSPRTTQPGDLRTENQRQAHLSWRGQSQCFTFPSHTVSMAAAGSIVVTHKQPSAVCLHTTTVEFK